MDPSTLLPLGLPIGAICFLVVFALRFNREDAGAAVAAQSAVLTDMKSLNDELIKGLERARDDLARERVHSTELERLLTECRAHRIALETEIRALRAGQP